jgi:hypothetical protein
MTGDDDGAREVLARLAIRADLSVSLIGSFRKHYAYVVDAAQVFLGAGMVIRSPVISEIIDQQREFVRFASDPPSSSDYQIQAATNEKIRESDMVYVVASGGYVGRATCYELGQIEALGIPTFFSEMPEDVPIAVLPQFVVTPEGLVARLGRTGRRESES